MGGRSSTHVANAYHEDIWVKVDAEREYVVMSKVTASGGAKGVTLSAGHTVKLDWHKVDTNGYSRIRPKQHLKFEVEMGRGKKTAYISLFTKSGQVICDALPRQEDKSIIISASGDIRETEYGRLWVDTSGYNHYK